MADEFTDSNATDAAEGSAAPPPGTLPSGTMVGKYRLVRLRGSGGQAIVYEGYDPVLERPVAIKQISNVLAVKPRFVERFRREAKILASLANAHPHIVSVYDLIEDDRGLFLVLEFVPGHSLQAVLDHQRYAMPPQTALEILWHIGGALKAAHDRGVVHRDVKPANLIVTRDYRAKITDFGVAAHAGQAESLALGTTKYMAPEVFEGQAVDVQADIYSLGFIAYEMLTGREFFDNLFTDVIRDVHSERLRWMKWHADMAQVAPPLAQVNPRVPVGLSDVVARMMAKDPRQRYARMDEVLADLRRAAGGVGQPAAPAPQAGPGQAATAPAGADLPPEPAGVETDEAPTAELPRKPFDRRKWLKRAALAAAVLAVALTVGLAVRSASQGARREQAQEAYGQALALYRNHQFAEALAAFEDVGEQFGAVELTVPSGQRRPVAQLAGARAAMARARLDLYAGRWDQALARIDHPSIRDAVGHEELADFAGEITVRRDATTALDHTAQAIAGRRLDDAQAELDRLDRLPLPTDVARRLEALQEDLADARVQAHYEGLLAGGDDAVGRNDFPAARLQYEQAQRVLDTPEVRQRIDELQGNQQLLKARTAARQAEEAGDLDAAIAAWQQAQAVRDEPAIRQRLTALRVRRHLQQADQARQAGRLADARDALRAALELDRTDALARTLAGVERALQREDLLAQADDEFRRGRYDQAVELFSQAAALEAGPDVDERIAEARFRQHWLAGDKARHQRDWEEAQAAYNRARAAKAHDAQAGRLVDNHLALLEQERTFYAHLDAARQLLAQDDYRSALREIGRAQELRATGLPIIGDEDRQLLAQARYRQEMTQAGDALAAENLRLALAHFKQARLHQDSDEVRRRIAEVEGRLSAAEP